MKIVRASDRGRRRRGHPDISSAVISQAPRSTDFWGEKIKWAEKLHAHENLSGQEMVSNFRSPWYNLSN